MLKQRCRALIVLVGNPNNVSCVYFNKTFGFICGQIFFTLSIQPENTQCSLIQQSKYIVWAVYV